MTLYDSYTGGGYKVKQVRVYKNAFSLAPKVGLYKVSQICFRPNNLHLF